MLAFFISPLFLHIVKEYGVPAQSDSLDNIFWSGFCNKSQYFGYFSSRLVITKNRKGDDYMSEDIASVRRCLNCGKEYVPRSTVQKYCDRTCGIAFRRTRKAWYPPVDFICAYCGREVSTMGGTDHRTRFCCQACEKKFWKHGRAKSKKSIKKQEELPV